ncbi:MAG TPA: hypothetical protein DDW27_12770 [Bacteroidales bacterium]|nr:hypothetical protein [Bacteroidales bacterium]
MKYQFKFFLLLFLFTIPVLLSAQKSYKAVCDKSDGMVKIVDNEDRSPNLIPLKGGFPFYQVAQNWVKENYPSGKCDPATAIKQNQAAADALTQSASGQKQAAPDQTRKTTDPNAFINVPPNQVPLPAIAPAPKYHNTSFFLSLLFSNLGKVYNLDPPLIPGINIGIEQMFGTKLFIGTGIHVSSLIGKTDEDAGVSSFYSFRIPLFLGYRQISGTRYWGVDLGLAANTMLKPLTNDSRLAGEIAADYSFNTLTRIRIGKERTAFEFGVDVWLNDILSSEEGFQMTILSLGYRYSF